MKNLYIFVALAAIALASCSKKDILNDSPAPAKRCYTCETTYIWKKLVSQYQDTFCDKTAAEIQAIVQSRYINSGGVLQYTRCTLQGQ